MSRAASAFPLMPPQDTASGVAPGYPCPDPGMSLRDYFAAHASEEDIQKESRALEEVFMIVTGGDGSKRTIMAAPKNWRQTCRYLHADAMLRARQP